MSLPDATISTILTNWLRHAQTNKPTLSLTHILSIITGFAKELQRVYASTYSKFFSFEINTTDDTQSFFINPHEITLPKNHRIKRMYDKRPNHPNQWLVLVMVDADSGTFRQSIIHDFMSNEVMKVIGKANFVSDQQEVRFINENSIMFWNTKVGYRNALTIQNLFDEEQPDIVIPMKGASNAGRISNDCFCMVHSRFKKLILCWPWDEQKENFTEYVKGGYPSQNIFWKNQIFVLSQPEDTLLSKRFLSVYDLNENTWEDVEVPNWELLSRVSRFFVYGSELMIVNSEDRYRSEDAIHVWLLSAVDGMWEYRNVDVPREFFGFKVEGM